MHHRPGGLLRSCSRGCSPCSVREGEAGRWCWGKAAAARVAPDPPQQPPGRTPHRTAALCSSPVRAEPASKGEAAHPTAAAEHWSSAALFPHHPARWPRSVPILLPSTLNTPGGRTPSRGSGAARVPPSSIQMEQTTWVQAKTPLAVFILCSSMQALSFQLFETMCH